MANKQYTGSNTLKALINVIVNALAGKVNKTDIVDNLESQSAAVPLAAKQGKALNDKITSLESKADATEQKIGQHNGIAPLNDSGLIDAQYLPSYVDDVIEGYYDAPSEDTDNTGKFYSEKPTSGDTYDPTKLITGEGGKIYIDLNTNVSYRWAETTYVAITAGNMVELTAEEIEAMWEAAGKSAEESDTGGGTHTI